MPPYPILLTVSNNTRSPPRLHVLSPFDFYHRITHHRTDESSFQFSLKQGCIQPTSHSTQGCCPLSPAHPQLKLPRVSQHQAPQTSVTRKLRHTSQTTHVRQHFLDQRVSFRARVGESEEAIGNFIPLGRARTGVLPNETHAPVLGRRT